MTNTLAIWIGALIVGAIFVDVMFFGTDQLLFLARKFTEFTEWMAFWR